MELCSTDTAGRRFELIDLWFRVMAFVHGLESITPHQKVLRDALCGLIEAQIGELCDGLDARSHTVHAYIIDEKHRVLFHLLEKRALPYNLCALIRVLDELSRLTYRHLSSPAERGVRRPLSAWPLRPCRNLGYRPRAFRRLLLCLEKANGAG